MSNTIEVPQLPCVPSFKVERSAEELKNTGLNAPQAGCPGPGELVIHMDSKNRIAHWSLIDGAGV